MTFCPGRRVLSLDSKCQWQILGIWQHRTDPKVLQRLATGIDCDDDDHEVAPHQKKTDISCPLLVEETPIEHNNGGLGKADSSRIDHHIREKNLS